MSIVNQWAWPESSFSQAIPTLRTLQLWSQLLGTLESTLTLASIFFFLTSRIITLTKNRNHKDTIQQMSTKQKDPCPALFPIPNEVSAVVNYTLHWHWAARKCQEPYKAFVTISPKQRAEGALISNIKGFRNA